MLLEANCKLTDFQSPAAILNNHHILSVKILDIFYRIQFSMRVTSYNDIDIPYLRDHLDIKRESKMTEAKHQVTAFFVSQNCSTPVYN